MYTYKIEQAIKAASLLHKDQFRQGLVAIPYVSHLFSVASIVADYTDDEDVIVAALLHDTLEDTDYTAEELEGDFGKKIRDIVESLSEPKDTEKKKYTWRERKQAYTDKLKKASDEALLIAAADKTHNMRSIVEEYADNHNRFLKEFSGPIEDRVFAYQNISNVINRRLKNNILREFNNVFTEYKNFIEDVKNKN